MDRISASDLRRDASEVISQVAYRGERVIVRRRGRDVAALVPMEDLQRIEALDDERDAKESERALREFKKSGDAAVPLDEVARDLGLRVRHRSS